MQILFWADPLFDFKYTQQFNVGLQRQECWLKDELETILLHHGEKLACLLELIGRFPVNRISTGKWLNGTEDLKISVGSWWLHDNCGYLEGK